MMILSKLKTYLSDTHELVGHTFWCPGCKITHFLKKDTWAVSGSSCRPSVSPSYHLHGKCHSIITNGIISFLPDCSHELAGYDVGMIPVCVWPETKKMEFVNGVLQNKKKSYLKTISENLKCKFINLILRSKKKPAHSWRGSFFVQHPHGNYNQTDFLYYQEMDDEYEKYKLGQAIEDTSDYDEYEKWWLDSRDQMR